MSNKTIRDNHVKNMVEIDQEIFKKISELGDPATIIIDVLTDFLLSQKETTLSTQQRLSAALNEYAISDAEVKHLTAISEDRDQLLQFMIYNHHTSVHEALVILSKSINDGIQKMNAAYPTIQKMIVEYKAEGHILPQAATLRLNRWGFNA